MKLQLRFRKLEFWEGQTFLSNTTIHSDGQVQTDVKTKKTGPVINSEVEQLQRDVTPQSVWRTSTK